MWTPCGFHIGTTWFPCGHYLVSMWMSHSFHIDTIWFPHGHMDTMQCWHHMVSTWILCCVQETPQKQLCMKPTGFLVTFVLYLNTLFINFCFHFSSDSVDENKVKSKAVKAKGKATGPSKASKAVGKIG